MPNPSLGFTVRIAEGERDLRDAAALRAEAYGHHLPSMAVAMAAPDALDRRAGVVVLIARDDATGRAVGTARIQRRDPRDGDDVALQIERSIDLAPDIAGCMRAEITRLAVRPGADPRVRLLLMKACWKHALEAGIRWLVIGARCAALIRIYRGLGFADLLAPGEMVPLAHAGGLPHRVLALDIPAAEPAWRASGHPLLGFMVGTAHAELQLGAARTPQALPRAA